MKFTGAKCALCNKVFEENDDVVVCPECGSPHHRKCWEEKGQCANSSLHGSGFSWEMPEELKKPEEKPAERTEDPELSQIKFKNGENVIKCPHCGAVNYGNDEYCLKCQKPLHGNENILPPVGTDPKQAEEQEFRRYQDSLRRFGGLNPEAPVDSIPVCELSDYIGGKNPGRIIRRIAVMERYGKKYSFSIAAFLFGPLWFFYRKMIKEGLLYTLILTAAMLLSNGLYAATKPASTYYKGMAEITMALAGDEITQEEYIDRSQELDKNLSSTVFQGNDKIKFFAALGLDYSVLAIQLVFAMKAMQFYRKKIKKDIEAARAKCTDFPSYQAELRKTGGTSPGLLILGIVIAAAAQLITNIPYAIIMLN